MCLVLSSWNGTATGLTSAVSARAGTLKARKSRAIPGASRFILEALLRLDGQLALGTLTLDRQPGLFTGRELASLLLEISPRGDGCSLEAGDAVSRLQSGDGGGALGKHGLDQHSLRLLGQLDPQEAA